MYMLANQTNAKHFSQTKPSKTFWHNKSCSDKSRKTICWQIKLYFGKANQTKIWLFQRNEVWQNNKKVPQAGQPVPSPTLALKTSGSWRWFPFYFLQRWLHSKQYELIAKDDEKARCIADKPIFILRWNSQACKNRESGLSSQILRRRYSLEK